MAYLNWDTKIITDFSQKNIATMYDAGYVFTRVDKGVMNRVRSFRVNLSVFEASSENRRIMRKSEHLSMTAVPLPYSDYSWEIGKLAKDFYDGIGAHFTANKVKELLTEKDSTNFTTLLVFTDTRTQIPVGYVICYEGGPAGETLLHYSYPFYVEDPAEPSRGLGMMTQAIEWAKAGGKKYIYLGSLQRSNDTYKLQFHGSEWFDGKNWRVDTEELKEILR